MTTPSFMVLNGVRKSEDGVLLHQDFPGYDIERESNFLLEPDGTLVEEDGRFRCERGCRFALPDSDVDEIKAWLAELRRLIKKAEELNLAPERKLNDFLKWPDGLLFGPGMCVKVAKDLAAWRPYIGNEVDQEFLSTYRYFQEMFAYAGTEGMFGVESWEFDYIPKHPKVLFLREAKEEEDI